MERVIDRKQRLLRHAEHYLEIYKLVLFFNISVPVWTGHDPVTLIASCGSYSHWERMLAVNMTMDRLPKNLSTLFFFWKLYNIQGLHKKIFHGIMTVKEIKKAFYIFRVCTGRKVHLQYVCTMLMTEISIMWHVI